MKKLVTVALAFFISFSVLGQKKELKKIGKLIKSEKYKNAAEELKLIEDQVKGTELESYLYFLYAKNFLEKDNKDQYPQATPFFTKVIASESKSPNKKYTEKSIKILKDINEYYLSSIENALAKENYEKLGDLYEAYSRAYPTRRDLLISSLYYYEKTTNVDEIVMIIEKLLELDTGEVSYLANNKYTNKVDEFFTKTQRLKYIKSKTHKRPKGENEVAIDSRNRVGYYNALVTVYNKKGESAKCLDLLRDAKNEFPNEVRFYEDIETLTSKGDDKEAHLLALKDLSKFKPNDRDLWFDLGILYNELGSKEESINAYDKVIAIDPNFSGSYINKANMIMADQNEIINEINNNLDNNKKYTELQSKLKNTYLNAIAQLEKAYSVQPTKTLKKTLISLYKSTDQNKKANILK